MLPLKPQAPATRGSSSLSQSSWCSYQATHCSCSAVQGTCSDNTKSASVAKLFAALPAPAPSTKAPKRRNAETPKRQKTKAKGQPRTCASWLRWHNLEMQARTCVHGERATASLAPLTHPPGIARVSSAASSELARSTHANECNPFANVGSTSRWASLWKRDAS